MYTSPNGRRSDSSRGPKKFGGSKPWDRGGSNDRGSFSKPMLHPATCADCGNRCEVPFKPNGKKPIFCSNCFVKEGGDSRPSYGDNRPSYTRPATGANTSHLEVELKKINAKLDAIIESLEA